MAHSLKHEYDEKFKAILLSKKRKPLNEIHVLNLNICSLVSRDNIIELHLAVLRAPEIIEVINLQETRGSKATIPGYTRHDSCCCMTTEFYAQIHGVATFTLDLETKDGLKLKTKKLDFVDKFLPNSTQQEQTNLNELSLIVLKVKKIRVNKNQDQRNFAYNEDLISTLFTNFYAPCAESEYASHKADLIFNNVLPAINSHVGAGKDFKENIMCCDSNAPSLKWEHYIPILKSNSNKNSNLVYKMFKKNKNLYQHVKFNTSIGSQGGSKLIDLVITTKSESVSNVINAGHIQEFSYHNGLLFTYTEELKEHTNTDQDIYPDSLAGPILADENYNERNWNVFNRTACMTNFEFIPIPNLRKRWNFGEISKHVSIYKGDNINKEIALICPYCSDSYIYTRTNSTTKHFKQHHEQEYFKNRIEQLLEKLRNNKWKIVKFEC
jgi:hypothetical protein